jgi:hypothetical protein
VTEVRAGGTASGWAAYRRQSDLCLRASVALTACLTAVWPFFVVTGRDGGTVFKGYQVDLEAVVRVAVGLSIMTVLWGWLWYGVKRLLLRKLAGFSEEELRAVFRSRLAEPFDLGALLRSHSERRVRIADMIGRRGRFFTIGLLGYIYSRVRSAPTPDFLIRGAAGEPLRRHRLQLAHAGPLPLERLPRPRGLRGAGAGHGRSEPGASSTLPGTSTGPDG